MTKRVAVGGKEKAAGNGTGRGMAKKTTTIVQQVPADQLDNGDELNDFDVSLEGVDDYEQLQDALQQFGINDGIVYKVYRVTPTGQSFCYETTEFSEQFLQQERGAGRYAVRIFIENRYKKTIHTEVDAPASGPASSQNQAGSGNAFLEKLLLALVMKEQSPTAPGPSLAELTTAMKNLDDMRGKSDPMGFETFFKFFTMAKDLVGDGGGAGDWKSELLKMGRDAIPAITSVVQSRVSGNGTPQPAVTTSQEQQPMHIDPATMTEDQKKALLKDAIAYLKPYCFRGLPAESALDFISVTAKSGNPQYQTMILAVLGYTFEEILEIDHELKSEPFHVFFRAIYDGLGQEFGPEDPVGDDPGGSVGDPDNARSDVESGKGGKP
jgi:hypothetical protein